MFGEDNFLLPIGQPFLRLEHRPNSGLQSNYMNFPAPGDDQGFTQISSRLKVNYACSEPMRDHQYGGSDQLAH